LLLNYRVNRDVLECDCFRHRALSSALSRYRDVTSFSQPA
jgi:hypothetical protein